MNIDTEHLHHWMNSIRISNNPMRTLDSFYAGQIKSKEWLIDELSNYVFFNSTIEIHGGWVGTLASLLFQSKIPVSKIVSIDVDPLCQHVAEEMNRIEFNQGKFQSITCDMTKFKPVSNIIINTSFEHITEEQYDLWISNLPEGRLVVLQSNNFDIPEHVRIAKDLDEFKTQSKLSKILYSGELPLSKYNRYMIIGYK